MAPLAASVPLSLLLDSLLASSWTWLALSLATIATLLRALSRITLSRHRPQVLLPSPPPSIFSAETELISPSFSEVLRPLGSACARELRSDSIPALKNVLHEPVGLACPESRSFSSMHDCHAAPLPLREAASAPNTDNGQPSSVCGDSMEAVLRLWPHRIDCKLGLRLRVGFLADTQKGGCKTPTDGFVKEDVNPHHFWASDVHSEYKSVHNSLFNGPYSSSAVPPCFEMQFRLCKLLEMKLGAPWRGHSSMQFLEPRIHDDRVVKVWSAHHRNLFKALSVEEFSVAALHVNIRGGSAITAHRNGGIFQWDIANQACHSRVCSNVNSVSALCWNAEKGVAIVADGEFLGLWDYKSPSLIHLMRETAKPVNVSPYSALQCEGNILRMDQINDVFSSCDLRKPQGSCLSIGTNPDYLQVQSRMEGEESFALWEKLAFDEEEFWDEYHISRGDALARGAVP